MMSALAPPIKMELAILLKNVKPLAGLNPDHVHRVMVSAALVCVLITTMLDQSPAFLIIFSESEKFSVEYRNFKIYHYIMRKAEDLSWPELWIL